MRMRHSVGLRATLLAALAAGCTERDSLGIGLGGNNGGTTGPVGIVSVVLDDDPTGAVSVPSGGSRPTVTVVVDAQLVGAANVTITDSNQVAIQVPIGQSSERLLVTNDSIRTGEFSQVRLTITRAQLAIPGQPEVTDLLAGAASATVTRSLAVTVGAGNVATLVIDLNSADWLSRVVNPAPGAPQFLFTGAVNFRNAIQVRAQAQ
jgi:hypothetical protein